MFRNQPKLMEAQMSIPTNAFVLVEEESEVRSYWAKIASEQKLALFTFSSATAFLPMLFVWNPFTRFYLDQDMYGVRGQGVQLAKIIRAAIPDSNINLVTAYPKSLFSAEIGSGLLNDVFGKYPEPFDRPEFTRMERAYEEYVWRAME